MRKGYGNIITLAISLAVTSGVVHAQQVPVNSVQDGGTVHGGTYANTADQQTTFVNSSGGSLWLKTGSNLRGVEVDAAGALTGNGGNFHFYAPGSVVRLDGNIDVRSVTNGSGAYLGNGGRVTVDAAYAYQNGNIYASGLNGGMVQFNVGSMTMANSARIEAKGFGGTGGAISINGSGVVDIGRNAVLDTSGKVAGTVDGNVIDIEGGAVNIEGFLQASGVESRGGNIHITASGQTDLNQTQEALAKAVTEGTFTGNEADALNTRLTDLRTSGDGDINLASANIYANGASLSLAASGNEPSDPSVRAGDGGSLIMSAERDINNSGWVLANGGNGSGIKGGNGGTVALVAGSTIENTGRIVTDGGNGAQGGDGGLTAFGYKDALQNSGVIRSMGGNGSSQKGGDGGLVVFASAENPSGTGMVVTYGGLGATQGKLGTVVAADPLSVQNPLIGVWDKTQRYEVLVNAENLLTFGSNIPDSRLHQTNDLNGWIRLSNIRSPHDPLGLGEARDLLVQKIPSFQFNSNGLLIRNLVINSKGEQPFSLYFGSIYVDTAYNLRSGGDAYNSGNDNSIRSLTINTDGDLVAHGSFPYMEGQYPERLVGANVSIIGKSLLNTNTDSSILAYGGALGGGHLSIAVKDSITNPGFLGAFGEGASVILKAGQDINNSGRYHNGYAGGIASSRLDDTYPFHGASQLSNAGNTMRIFAGHDFNNSGYLYAPGIKQGGIVTINAGNRILFDNSTPTLFGIMARATFGMTEYYDSSVGYGGYVNMRAKSIETTTTPTDASNPFNIDVYGPTQNGQVVIQETP